MKLSNAVMVTLYNTLEKFPSATGKIGYAIARSKRILKENLADYEDARSILIKKYGKETEDGDWIVKNEKGYKYKEFMKEFNELLGISVDVDLYQLEYTDFEIPYNENASVQDYDIIEEYLIKKPEITDKN